MSQPAIIIENLSKQYRLGDVGTGTLSHDLKRWWYAVRGKEDPFAKIGETNDRTQKGNSEYVWALKDINLQINQGDAVGIIGRNGAGKSTLLKLLSKTTAPTSGSIKVKGRIASLLEVGTGFHPELSGRDNIYLNGAILGMRKREIDRKLDEIVDFAGIERYLDTPVKRYSSGMYVRLAFAVAAHLDSDILIVDEVLAVGDAEFQKKCLGKMGEVSQGQGRTVLFVSHNMGSIKNLCSTAIYLKNGTVEKSGEIDEVVRMYITSSILRNTLFTTRNNNEQPICITEVKVNLQSNDLIDVQEQLEFSIKYIVNNPQKKHSIAFFLKSDEVVLAMNFVTINDSQILDTEEGEHTVITKNFPKGLLKAGRYSVDIACGVIRTKPIQFIENAISFELDLLSGKEHNSIYSANRQGLFVLPYNWESTRKIQ